MLFQPRPEDAMRGMEERSPRHASLHQTLAEAEQDVTIKSLGEYILPFFLAAVEACWFNGILIGLAGLNFLASNVALLPFWAPVLLLLGSLWLFRRVLQQEGERAAENEESLLRLPGLRLMFGVIGLLTICLVWLQVYAGSAWLIDPNWLLAFLGDAVALNTHFYQALGIIGIAVYLCWRGMRHAQVTVEPGQVFKHLWVGLLVFLLAILVRASHPDAGVRGDDVILLLMLPLFLYLALSAHALARVAWIRRDHPVGLQGSVADQERSMLSVIGIIGVFLLGLTIIGGTAFSPAFFGSIQPVFQAVSTAYSWLASILAQALTWLLTPFFWLASLWFSAHPQNNSTLPQRINGTCPSNPPKNKPLPSVCRHPLQLHADASATTLLVAKIALPILIFLVLFLLVRWALRKRIRVRISRNKRGGDVHESVWSWGLFWGQLRGILFALFGRFFPKRASDEEAQQRAEEIAAPPAARTIREIYRALLKKAASRGQIRKRDETPYEFQHRLDQREPQNEPQLGMLTEAYALTRYGGGVPNERELATIRQFWNELEQKWETSPN